MVVNSSAIHAVLWGMRISSGFKRWSWQNYWAVTTGSPRRNPWPAWERCSGEEKQKADASRAGQEKRRMISGVMRREREGEREEEALFARGVQSAVHCAPLRPARTPLIQKYLPWITRWSWKKRSGRRKIWPSFISTQENRWSCSKRRMK